MSQSPALQISLSPIPANIKKKPEKIKNLSKSTSKLNKLSFSGLKTGRWTPEARAKQAARIRLQKPWQHSTGPKTAVGKKKTSRNSLKHGHRSARTKRFKRILRDVKKYLAQVRLYNREARERRRQAYQADLLLSSRELKTPKISTLPCAYTGCNERYNV